MRWSLAVAVEQVAAGGADAQRADPAGVDLGPGGQEGDGRLEVLDALERILQAARRAAGLALVRGVEGERDVAPLREQRRVQPGCLLLDAGAGVAHDDRGSRAVRGALGNVEVGRQLNARAVEGDIYLVHRRSLLS